MDLIKLTATGALASSSFLVMLILLLDPSRDEPKANRLEIQTLKTERKNLIDKVSELSDKRKSDLLRQEIEANEKLRMRNEIIKLTKETEKYSGLMAQSNTQIISCNDMLMKVYELNKQLIAERDGLEKRNAELSAMSRSRVTITSDAQPETKGN